MKVVDTKEELDNLVKTESRLLVVDFYADWCGPCRMIAPKLEEFKEKYTNVLFVKVNVDENEEASEAYGVSAMPTFKFFKGGKEVAEIVGASEAKIREKIEALA